MSWRTLNTKEREELRRVNAESKMKSSLPSQRYKTLTKYQSSLVKIVINKACDLVLLQVGTMSIGSSSHLWFFLQMRRFFKIMGTPKLLSSSNQRFL